MDLQKINAVGQAEVEMLPLKRLAELKVKRSYQVTRMFKAKTKYGQKIMAELDFKKAVFLPERMVKFFQENSNEWDSMQEAIQDDILFMIYLGTRHNKIEFTFADNTSEVNQDSDASQDSEEEEPTPKKLKKN